MIQTVLQYHEVYTERDIKEAIMERKAQLKLGNTSEKEFMKMVRSKSGVKSMPVNIHSITVYLLSMALILQKL